MIEGRIFIVPNVPFTKKEIGWDNTSKWYEWAGRTQELLNKFEGRILVEEPMIEVWAGNELCDNFAAHMVDYAKMIGVVDLKASYLDVVDQARDEKFPTHLPYSLLKGLKEGDTLRLERKNGVVFELKASQSTTRYRRFGNFEEVLEKLL